MPKYLTEDEVRDIVSQCLNNFAETMRVKSGIIQSGNFVTGSAGWKLSADGSLEANNGTFRGAITATSGTISGNLNVTGSLNTGSLSSYHASFATYGSNSGLFILDGSSNILAGMYFISGGVLIDSDPPLAINSADNITINVASGKKIRFSVDDTITAYVDDTGIHNS